MENSTEKLIIELLQELKWITFEIVSTIGKILVTNGGVKNEKSCN